PSRAPAGDQGPLPRDPRTPAAVGRSRDHRFPDVAVTPPSPTVELRRGVRGRRRGARPARLLIARVLDALRVLLERGLEVLLDERDRKLTAGALDEATRDVGRPA